MHFGRKLRLAVTGAFGLRVIARSHCSSDRVVARVPLQHQELLLLQREQPLIRTGSSLPKRASTVRLTTSTIPGRDVPTSLLVRLGDSVTLLCLRCHLRSFLSISRGDKTVTYVVERLEVPFGPNGERPIGHVLLEHVQSVARRLLGLQPGYGIPDQVSSVTHTRLWRSRSTSRPSSTHCGLRTTTSTRSRRSLTRGTYFFGSKVPRVPPVPYAAASTKVACTNVYNYLNNLSSQTTSYTGSLWQSGDTGPWRLTSSTTWAT